MKTFKDANGNTVTLSFSDHTFPIEAKHIFVICRYQNQWLFTKHKERGLEFPGGKVEALETVEAAAKREVYEETGAIVEKLIFVGQYMVSSSADTFVKNVYFAEIKEIQNRNHYLETEGPVLKNTPLTPEVITDEYSFIMKDDVVQLCLHWLKKQGIIL
ncbi:RNA deprotection pyrophosphohydrolase [Bacillus andreraoultii]|uniref:RNA deprotection pyrophosphohydrolase n=1 Tax=Bacillus andreraoultii TaxID=1499685 RepID=UPI00053B3595|nr:nucleoside triphosphatase YtkD [Bacillus andreraoultii]